MELPVHPVQRARLRLVADRSLHHLAADHATQAQPTHQPFHRAPGHLPAFPQQLPPHLAHPVDLTVLVPDSADLHLQSLVPPPAVRIALRIGLTDRMVVVRRRSDLKYTADRLDSVGVTVFGHEPRHGLKWRSSSAWAKYADALRRISLACRSSRFSRSSAFIRARSSVV